MHDDADFLRAILADPFDDAPRLIYAEWLEDRAHESGGVERCQTCKGRGFYSFRSAEFGHEIETCGKCRGSGRIPDHRAARAEFIRVQCRIDQLTQGSDEEIRLQIHLTEMMLTHGDCCYGEIPPDRWTWSASYIDRGFVSGISCTLAAFMQHAAEIFAKHPVTGVRLTDREPATDYSGGFFWRSSSRFEFPDSIPLAIISRSPLDMCRLFPTADAARVGLSRACVDYGRLRAVLPPLTWPAVRESELSGISG